MALSPITARKLDDGLAVLAIEQQYGVAPVPGKVSLQDIASRAGVSAATVLKVEQLARAKVISGLLAHDLPPHLHRQLTRLLNP